MSHNEFTINVQQVYKSFKTVTALDGISLHLAAGVMHGIIGPEGAGKSTLMRIILGLLKPNEGTVEFRRDDQIVNLANIRDSIAYMPERQSLYADLSIDEHLEFFKDLYGMSDEAYEIKRSELLEVTRLGKFVDRLAGQLSGGMYKKLGLMCALLRSPRIVLLDEPTNGVDPISRREFWDLLYKLADQKILIILTTAYMDEAERCGYVHLLEHGKVVDKGEPRQLLAQENVKSFDELFMKNERNE